MKAPLLRQLVRMDHDRHRTLLEDYAMAGACLQALTDYRLAAMKGRPRPAETKLARQALLHLGGDPVRSSISLKDYDHVRFGPFLGVSDEGSAADAIRTAAWASPKAEALSRRHRTPLAIGVALDAERLGGVGEVNVGPEEYADVWLGCVDRVLITTNVATRVNLRHYRREPVVPLTGGDARALVEARQAIANAFKPFVETPDCRPRPLTVFVDIHPKLGLSKRRRRALLRDLARFVSSGRAAGLKRAPVGQQLGLATWVKLGPAGRDQTIAAIELAAGAGIRTVLLEGVKRKAADRAVSLAGLLDYFPPGLVGPILRAAKRAGVTLRAANLPDTDTIARSTWAALATARAHGVNLGKYGCFPLTLAETDHVVQQVQAWFADWSAAPVFFVDQGVLRDGSVDVDRDLMRGLTQWLRTVAAHRVPVVLIDTIDKATGRRLLRKFANDPGGYLGWRQIVKVESLARRLRIKVLWAGGLGLAEAFALGRLGVFGLYVTSAAAVTIPVAGSYERDPALAGLKEPSREAVWRTKTLIEAGFLCDRLGGDTGQRLSDLAGTLLAAHDRKDPAASLAAGAALAAACVTGWRAYWKQLR